MDTRQEEVFEDDQEDHGPNRLKKLWTQVEYKKKMPWIEKGGDWEREDGCSCKIPE